MSGIPIQASGIGSDNRRRLTAVTQVADLSTGLGSTTTYVLDDNGNRTAVIDPDARITNYVFDAADRLIQTRDSTNVDILSQNVYDDNDAVKETYVAHPVTGALVLATSRTFWPDGSVKTETDVFGNLSSFFYAAP